jgi:hypothetical protein
VSHRSRAIGRVILCEAKSARSRSLVSVVMRSPVASSKPTLPTGPQLKSISANSFSTNARVLTLERPCVSHVRGMCAVGEVVYSRPHLPFPPNLPNADSCQFLEFRLQSCRLARLPAAQQPTGCASSPSAPTGAQSYMVDESFLISDRGDRVLAVHDR